ncbi:MAG: undecaprenyldiphospho-muramoylpentapeptide beta-N-acetylglucosaminyltransferase [Candidatus Pacebacteria bacterium]|nr:undecaprenyldiphospho-muramoylpentapeptide beta-N-acetylglucosaminyltransferase [Candidatus Paceibacterota bacterium]
MKIVFTGGGTGGHIFPIIAVARELKTICIQKKEKLEMFFIGPGDNNLVKTLNKENIFVKIIPAGKLRRYFSFKNISDILFKIPAGIFKARVFLMKIRPDVIFSKGGYGSLPVVYAAKILDIPVIVHESDAAVGMANSKAFKSAKIIMTGFPLTNNLAPKEKTIFLGNPLRKELLDGKKEEGIKIFKITQQKPILLVLGGSQGAVRINNAVLESLNNILDFFEIIHQCGDANFEEMKMQSNIIFQQNPEKEKYYHLYGFLNEEQMKHALKISNLVITRAGAGTIFEILACGIPSILVPLKESAQNHQQKNAYFVQERGAGIVVEEQNLMPNYLIERLKRFFSSPDILKEMSKKALEISIPNSAYRIADLIIDFVKKN